jgi:lysophospholipase L1-like esterase
VRTRLLIWIAAALAVAGVVALAWPSPSDDAGEPPRDIPTIAFLGDSLTLGLGAPAGRGFAWQTAELLEWPIAAVDGVSGSGYVVPGEGEPLPERVERIIAADPDVVVVAAGTNDSRAGVAPQAVARAARQALSQLEEALPDAVIVVVGPFPASLPALGGDDEVAEAIRSQAAGSGAEYLPAADLLAGTDPRRWFAYLSPDDLHPNEAGHAVLAEALAGRIVELAGPGRE